MDESGNNDQLKLTEGNETVKIKQFIEQNDNWIDILNDKFTLSPEQTKFELSDKQIWINFQSKFSNMHLTTDYVPAMKEHMKQACLQFLQDNVRRLELIILPGILWKFKSDSGIKGSTGETRSLTMEEEIEF